MTDTLAHTASPPHHLKVWSDGQRIYCEIPGVPPKPAYVTTFVYDSRGVDLVLSLLGIHRVNYDYQGTVPVGYTGRSNFQNGSDSQHAMAEKLLRQAGIIK